LPLTGLHKLANRERGLALLQDQGE